MTHPNYSLNLSVRELVQAHYESEEMSRIEDMLEFDGPPTCRVGDVPYVTLTQYGPKAEGQSCYTDPDKRCWTAAEAIWRFKQTLWEYLVASNATQIAWRSRPRVEQTTDGDYIVRCRLALIGVPAKKLRAAA